MATDKQIQANRENARHSTGPVTPEGKARVSQNAVTHGMLTRAIILQNESGDRFRELLESLVDEHQPEGPTENMLVETIAAARWRQLRLLSIETATMDHELDRQKEPATLAEFAALSTDKRASLAFRLLAADRGNAIDLMNRYESRLDRQIRSAEERLFRLRQRRLQ